MRNPFNTARSAAPLKREVPQIKADSSSVFVKVAQHSGWKRPRMVPEPKCFPRFLDAPGPDLQLSGPPLRILRRVTAHQLGFFVVSMVVSVGFRLSGIALPLVIGDLIDEQIQLGLGANLLPGMGKLVALIAVTGVFWLLDQVLNTKLNPGTQAYLSRSVGVQALSKGTALSRERGTGDVLTVVTDDSAEIGFFMLFMPALVAGLITIVVSGWIMVRSSLVLGTLVIVGLPLAVLAVSLLSRPLRTRQMKAQNARADLNTIANDVVLGLRVLRGLGGQSRFVQRYRQHSSQVQQQGNRVVIWSATQRTLTVAVPALFQAAIVALGAWLVYSGAMSAGTLVAFFGMTTYLQAATDSIVTGAQAIVSASVSSRRMSRVLEVPGDFTEKDFVSEAQNPSLNRVLKSCEVFDPVSGIRVVPGRLTMVVAPDLSLADRLARSLAWIDPDPQVYLGGRLLSDFDLSEVRRSIVYVHGEDGLFAGSLREALLGVRATVAPPLAAEEVMAWYHLMHTDLAPGGPGLPDFQDTADDRRLKAVLDQVKGDDIWGSLGSSLDGELLEKGRNLSGGQRQRLVVARGLARQAPLLILSEPTSALDKNTEGAIADNLVNFRKDLTTLVVTASPLLLRHADYIYVLDGFGRVTGGGTHRQLLDPTAGDLGVQYRQILAEQSGSTDFIPEPGDSNCLDSDSDAAKSKGMIFQQGSAAESIPPGDGAHRLGGKY